MLTSGCVGPMVARSTEDREVRGLNPILAQREFLRAQEMNLRGSTRPRYVCGLHTKPGRPERYFPNVAQ